MKQPHQPLLAPSILGSDHANLTEGVAIVESLELQWLHLDIMDGHFVPNLSFGPGTVKALRKRSGLFFDVHLMLDNPHLYVEAFSRAGADLISIHVEPGYDIEKTLEHIRDLGCKTGIVLNPGTPVGKVFPYLETVDLVLAMTVQPGFGGQSFREDVLPKLAELNSLREHNAFHYRLEVDGGIDLNTAKLCRAQGVDTFVAGTSFFNAEDKKAFAETISSL